MTQEIGCNVISNCEMQRNTVSDNRQTLQKADIPCAALRQRMFESFDRMLWVEPIPSGSSISSTTLTSSVQDDNSEPEADIDK